MIASMIGFVALFVMALGGVPLAIATLSVGIVGFSAYRGLDASISMAGQWIIDSTMSYNLSVIPLFLMMGSFLHRARISDELFTASNAWLGHRPGGMAMATVGASAGFAAVCGSSLATAATMTRVAMGPMRKFGYDDRLSTGALAAGGTLGILIPPSVPLVIYGLIAREDIGRLFIAGIVPGLLMTGLFLFAIRIVVWFRPASGPRGPRLAWSDVLRRSVGVWPIMMLFAVVLGGIYAGIFTPTEAAAVGAIGAFLFAFARGRMRRLSELREVAEETIRTTAMIFVIIFSAMIFAQFVNISGLPYQLAGLVAGLHPLALVLAICAICILLGTVFEALGILLLIIPVFIPSLEAANIDLIWFGIVIVIVIELGLITPPIGMNVFVVRSIVPEVGLGSVFAGVMPFVGAMLLCLALVLTFPVIATGLPDLMN